jgi:DNA-directed RNA polymerase I subunit RPA2
VNGNERLIRFLVLPRRNHVLALIRPSFQNRGPTYTEFATQIRCVREDQSSHTNTLHYQSNGGMTMRFSWRKSEYLVPVILILKALVSCTDKEIFLSIVQNDFENTFLTDRVELLLRSFNFYNLFTQKQSLEYLGVKFRTVLGCPDDFTNEEVGRSLLEDIILVHLNDTKDKWRLLM